MNVTKVKNVVTNRGMNLQKVKNVVPNKEINAEMKKDEKKMKSEKKGKKK